MSDKIRAAEELKKFARSFKNVLELCEDLEKAGSLEQTARDLESRHNFATVACEEAERKLVDIGRSVASAQAQIVEAKEQAAAIVAAAKQEAQDAKDAAAVECQNMVNAAKADITIAQGEAATIRSEISALTVQREQLQAEVETLMAKKEAAREQLRKLVEG